MPPKTRSSRKAASKATTTVAQGSTADVGQLQSSPDASMSPCRVKERAPSKKPESHPEKMTLESGRIVGAKMSNFKHSGLLERDERARKETLEEEDVIGSSLQLTTTRQALSTVAQSEAGEGEGEEGDVQRVSGRDIYAIQSLGRSAQKAKRKRSSNSTPTAPHGRKKVRAESREEEKSVEDGGYLGGGEIGNKDGEVDNKGARTRTTKAAATSRPSEGTSARGGRKEKGNYKGKGRSRKAAQFSSDSEQESLELSEEEKDDEEEGEELASIAAQLNSGVAGEHALEDYFTAHTGKAGVTSDHTLSRLARPRLEQEAVQTALCAAPSPFHSDCQRLYEDYSSLYPYWLLQMHNGFNILLYGLGSKKRLMEDFCKQCLSRSCCLVVNGYFPGLTVKQILSNLSSDLLGHDGSFKSHSEHAQFITSTLENQSRTDIPQEVFLLVHNVDGSMLRNERAQASLSLLAASQHIHVIASVDHINAALLWDQTKLGRFNWLWHDVTTFEPYREETSYENSLLVQHSGSLALSSLTHVLKSLTPNARGIFEMLAKYQLEHKKEAEKNYQGLSFSDCYRRCRERFLVNSDLTLRAQLTEFRDHKLVRSTKGSDGVEYLSIPVDDATLSQFLDEFIKQ